MSLRAVAFRLTGGGGEAMGCLTGSRLVTGADRMLRYLGSCV
jgi:hypothetical protein